MSQNAAFVILQMQVFDWDKFATYAKSAASETVRRFGGEVRAVSRAPQTLEGNWPSNLTVVIEFEDETAARTWYESAEYQAVIGLRHAAANANTAMIVSGPAA